MTNQARMTNDMRLSGLSGRLLRYSRLLISTALAIALSATTPCGAIEVQLTTLDGRKLEGTLKQLASDRVVVQVGETETTVEDTDLHLVTLKAPPEKSSARPVAWVELVDGSRLPVASYIATGGKVIICMLNEKKIELATRQVRSVRFGRLDERDAEIGRPDAAGDLLGIRKRENVDFLDGVIGDVTTEIVEFTLEGEKIPVNRSKVEGIVYAHKASDEDITPACIVEDSAGALVKAKKVQVTDDILEVVTLAGPIVHWPLTEIRKVDFSAGKLVYLSDLKPESVQWTSFFDLANQAPSLARFMAPAIRPRPRGRGDAARWEGIQKRCVANESNRVNL